MHRYLAALLGAILLVGPAHAEGVGPDLSFDEQWALFLERFPGRYDSALQVELEEEARLDPLERNYRRHSIFRRVDLPAFGETVFYAEQYRDGDPDKVYRQRIYQITRDDEAEAFRLRVHVPKDQQAIRGAYRNPQLLAQLTPADTTVWEGCDLLWTYAQGRFVGEVKPGACRFSSKAFGQDIVLEEVLTLTSEAMHFADRGLSLDGEYLFGMRGEIPNISRRVRPFVCDVEAQGSEGQSTGMWTHDQGGEVWLDAPGQGGAKPLRMRMLRWQGLPVGLPDELRLELLAAGDNSNEGGGGAASRPLATASAGPDAEQIGLSLGGIAVNCSHAPDRLYADGRGETAP